MKKKKASKIFLILLIVFWISYLLGLVLSCLVHKGFEPRYLIARETMGFTALFLLLSLVAVLLYAYNHWWIFRSKKIMEGKDSDLHFSANLEEARFQSEEEMNKNYETYDFEELKDREITGAIIKAKEEDGKLKVTFAKPAHTLVIGTTGSGKTATFVNPSIQILSELKNHPSMLISDPKGELYQSNAKALRNKGYEVKVLDLRNPYNSVRWNPLERPYLLHQRAMGLEKEIAPDEEQGCYFFEGNQYWSKEEVDCAIQVRRQQLNDQVYEDLNDICAVLCPVTNKEEPMWESGAQHLILAIALAMLEDSDDPKLGMTKEKYNFYSIMKVATSTEDECKELIDYFHNRSPLSKASSLSKQVMDSSEKTRGSYLSSTFDKISMFSDLSLCSLTSSNEIEFGSMGEKPIALFLQIPDEKETRHTLASMVILQAYKELVNKANSYPSLSLPRPVYFLLDEFGNLPKIHKLEQMVTVGRSRNIWLHLVIQSYSQLSKVYDEKSADIIKSNCNIQVWIGSTDLKSAEEFSKRCGNYSIVQRSVGYQSAKADDISSNSSVKERPLIYPSELQTLNNPRDMGHAIVTVFGYQPIRSTFMPCFQVPQFDMEKIDQKLEKGRFFDEKNAYYDMKNRNRIVMENQGKKTSAVSNLPKNSNEQYRSKLILEQILKKAEDGIDGILDDGDSASLADAIQRHDTQGSVALIEKAEKKARSKGKLSSLEILEDVKGRIISFFAEEERPPMNRKS